MPSPKASRERISSRSTGRHLDHVGNSSAAQVPIERSIARPHGSNSTEYVMTSVFSSCEALIAFVGHKWEEPPQRE